MELFRVSTCFLPTRWVPDQPMAHLLTPSNRLSPLFLRFMQYPCPLVAKENINHDSVLLTFGLPPNECLNLPVITVDMKRSVIVV